ncbi:MAG: T9SS C-terminal target domain-containing protein [Cytophagales bacterium]|nr:MAG: T9SS C-terminal target domain-containing protein [Cytophagales bacterium]
MKKLFPIVWILSIVFSLNKSFAQQTIQINLDKEYQTITGFGGFGPKKVWWESAPYHDKGFLDVTIDKLGSTIFRTEIFEDLEPVNDNNDPNVLDESKLKFGATTGNGKQFPFLKDLNARGIKIIASVWTPPYWMKDFSDPKTIPDECYNCWNCPKPWSYPIPENRKMCGGVLRSDMYEEYAEYLVAYVKTIKKQTGIDLYAISIQNEALFPNPFQSCVLAQKPYADALKVIGARFKKEGLPQLFFGPEHMAEYSWGGNREYVNQLFTQSTSGKDYLDIFAVHGYLDGVANDFGTATGWTNLYNEITVKNGKPLWMTETGNLVPNDLTNGLKFAQSMHLALKFGHISGWVFWYFNENLVKDNLLTHTGNSMKMYYKHILPGFINVESSATDKEILVTAFKRNKGIVIVAINNGTTSKTVSLSTGKTTLPASFKVYRYSANETGELINTVMNNSFSLPAKSVSTLVFEDNTTAIEETLNSSNLKIYPTEVYYNEINIDYTGNNNLKNVSLISIDGKEIKNIVCNDNIPLILNTEGVPKGLYILKVNTDKSVKSEKINIR